MKRMRRIIGIVAGIIIFFGNVDWLDYICVPASDSDWERILWHNFYEDKGKIDNLYLGSSHVYMDIDPFLLDELNGQYNFNLASPMQLMNGTYYLLREADRYNKLSRVYIELYYMSSVENNFDGNKDPIKSQPYRNWNNTDYMKLSFNKIAYMRTIADVEQYVNICMPFSRYRENLFDWEVVGQTIEEKENKDYTNFASYRVEKDEVIMRKGFRHSERRMYDDGRFYRQDRILRERPMSETSECYLRKAIAYCQSRKIPVTLFVSPIYDLQLVSTENYDNYLEQIREIANEYNVELYDFNLAKEKYLPIQESKYFRDMGHLNSAGTALYTEFFYRVVSGEASENAKYFYESYEQKMQNTEPSVYGIYYRETEGTAEGVPQMKNMWIASNRDEDMEYRIILTPVEGEQYMVQDFSSNNVFRTDSVHGDVTIVYRMKSNPDTVQTVEINY